MNSTTVNSCCGTGVSHPTKSVRVSVPYNKEEADWLKREAVRTGRSLAGMIRFVSLRYLEEEEKKSQGVSHQ